MNTLANSKMYYVVIQERNGLINDCSELKFNGVQQSMNR